MPDSSPDTPYERLGGAEGVQALVARFYALMDSDPRFTALRDVHAADLDRARERLGWFLSGWLGGPPEYTDRVGPPMLRARHLPRQLGGRTIGIVERDQWLACMDQAMRDRQVPDALRHSLGAAFFRTADWMRNRDESAG